MSRVASPSTRAVYCGLCVTEGRGIDGGLDVVVLVLEGVDVLVRHDPGGEGIRQAADIDHGDVALLRAVVPSHALAGQRLEHFQQVRTFGQEPESRQQDLVRAQLGEVIGLHGREVLGGGDFRVHGPDRHLSGGLKATDALHAIEDGGRHVLDRLARRGGLLGRGPSGRG